MDRAAAPPGPWTNARASVQAGGRSSVSDADGSYVEGEAGGGAVGAAGGGAAGGGVVEDAEAEVVAGFVS
jgi:hypothetical protein